VHDIDTIRFVLQDEVRDVHAVVGPKTDQYTEYEDSIALTLRFERGAIATLQVAPHDPLRDFYESFGFAVLCEGGGIRYNPEIPAVEYASRSGLQPGDRTVEPFPNRRQDLDSAYHREFTNFAQVVRGTQPPLLTAEDGLRTVEIMQAAYQSVTTGSTVRLQRATLDHER
jgi:predicted dehydrogenase